MHIHSWHFKGIVLTEQHEFTKARFTFTNLVQLIDKILHSRDYRSSVSAIYTIFSKAFDKVNYQILRKLSIYSITEPLVGWCESYLGGTTSVVVVNVDSSDPFRVSSGVTQGSHLGLLLFDDFINDVDQYFRHPRLLLLADDLQFMQAVNINDDIAKLHEDIYRLDSWCDNNQKTVNVSKCIQCTSRQPSIHD